MTDAKLLGRVCGFNQYLFDMKTIIFYFFLIIISACNTPKKVEKIDISNQNQAKSAIFFLSFKIYKDLKKGTNIIELIDKTKVEGELKRVDDSQNLAEDNLILEFIDHEKIVKTIVLPHPLQKNVEFAEGNELKSKQVKLNEAEFFIRLQLLDHDSNKIIISEAFKNNKPIVLSTLKI